MVGRSRQGFGVRTRQPAQERIAILEAWVTRHPTFPDGHARLGGAYESRARDLATAQPRDIDGALDHFELAITHFRKALELGGDEYHDITIRALADLYVLLHRSAEREAFVYAAVTQFPDTPQENTMKVAVFFVTLVLAILIPVGGIILVGFFGPPPYIVTAEPGRDWRNGVEFEDGTRVLARTYDDEASAQEVAARVAGGIETSRLTQMPGLTSYRRADNRREGLIVASGPVLVHVEGPDWPAVERRIAQLDFLAENTTKNPVWVAFSEQALASTLAGMAGYLVVLILVFARLGSWAARIDPEPTAQPVQGAELRRRLLAINDLETPFEVREVKSGRFVAEWRVADAKWSAVLQQGAMRRVHRIHLDLDERARTVRAVHSSHAVSREAGLVRFAAAANWSQGISFGDNERGRLPGLLFDPDTGWTIRDDYHYRFDVSEMRAPLVAAVTGSGWRWTPVFTLFRPIGG